MADTTPTAAHMLSADLDLQLEHTPRGFALIKFADRYNVACSLQASSLATEEAIWIGPDDAAPKILASQAAAHGIDPGDGTGWVQFPIPCGVSLTTRMHLTRAQVAALLPTLAHFAETGEVIPIAQARVALTGQATAPAQAAPSEQDERVLPPLPKPVAQIGRFDDEYTDVFDGSQMRAYARAAQGASGAPTEPIRDWMQEAIRLFGSAMKEMYWKELENHLKSMQDKGNKLLAAPSGASGAQGEPVADFNDWMAKRGPLGAGAHPSRAFIAGHAYGRRAAQGEPTGATGAAVGEDVAQIKRAYEILLATCGDLGRALYEVRDMVGHPDNIAFIDKALATAGIPRAAASQAAPDSLRKSVRAIVQLIRGGEWADLLDMDADAVALWSAVDGLLVRASQAAPGVGADLGEPTMLWDAEEPEDGTHGDSPMDFARNYICDSGLQGEVLVDVLCAYRGGKRTMRIVATDDQAVTWSWANEPALPAPVQPAIAPVVRADVPAQHMVICERCQGSGEGKMLVGGGPDAYEIDSNCAECGGIGEVAASPSPSAPHDLRLAALAQAGQQLADAQDARTDRRERLGLSPSAPQGQDKRPQWSKEPPTEQADYWNWNGDPDHAPMIYHVLWSGTAKKCFVSIGQYDITNAIFCDTFGGWWLKIEQPAIPSGHDSANGGERSGE